MLMAQYGARVYKIEGVDHGDMGRTWGPPFQGGEASYFLGLNTGKQAAAVNLKDPRGLDLCLRMAARADVLIENMRPGAMQRLGLGYDAVKASNPRLVYCSISGYGQNGPSREEPAMDLIMQASCGLIGVTGSPGGGLARCGHSVADVTAGMFALVGILMALRARDATGEGQFVDVSMLDGMISAMASNFAHFLGSGIVPEPMGTAFATIVPYACFPTADRDITIAVASEKLWSAFCAAVGHPGWAADPRFESNPARVANRAVLEPMIADTLRARPANEWLAVFRAAGVPCTPVRTLDEVAADPQAAARGMFPVVDHAGAGAIRVTGTPVKFEKTPGAVDSAAPLHGQHTAETMRDLLGLAPEEVEALMRAGAIAGPRV